MNTVVVVVVVCAAGSILIGAGYQGGLVKVFYLTVDLQWSSLVVLTATLATELNVLGKSGESWATLTCRAGGQDGKSVVFLGCFTSR